MYLLLHVHGCDLQGDGDAQASDGFLLVVSSRKAQRLAKMLAAPFDGWPEARLQEVVQFLKKN